jgi:hypothetical protein
MLRHPLYFENVVPKITYDGSVALAAGSSDDHQFSLFWACPFSRHTGTEPV